MKEQIWERALRARRDEQEAKLATELSAKRQAAAAASVAARATGAPPVKQKSGAQKRAERAAKAVA
jgi:hypothetical protein